MVLTKLPKSKRTNTSPPLPVGRPKRKAALKASISTAAVLAAEEDLIEKETLSSTLNIEIITQPSPDLFPEIIDPVPLQEVFSEVIAPLEDTSIAPLEYPSQDILAEAIASIDNEVSLPSFDTLISSFSDEWLTEELEGCTLELIDPQQQQYMPALEDETLYNIQPLLNDGESIPILDDIVDF